jgi:hypothetical protein
VTFIRGIKPVLFLVFHQSGLRFTNLNAASFFLITKEKPFFPHNNHALHIQKEKAIHQTPPYG